MPARPCGSVLESEAEEPGRVKCVDSRPAVGAIRYVGGGAFVECDLDQAGDEAVMVERAVHGRREADDRGADPALGQREHRVLRHPSSHCGGGCVGWVSFGSDPPWGEHERAGGDHERFLRLFEGLSNRLDGPQVGRGGVDVRRRVVHVCQVDDPVGRGSARAQAVEVVEVAAVSGGPRGAQDVGRLLRAGKADDVVSGGEQFRDDGRTDVTGRAGDKDTHFGSS